MNYKMFLITRFNAPCFKSRSELEVNNLNPIWLRSRLEMFKKFCYPSVMNQSMDEFTWLLWVHPESPDWFLDEVTLPGIEIITARDWEGIVERVQVPEILVTTRLDSDDLIHRDFMLKVRDHGPAFRISREAREIFAFRHGYRYYVNKGPRGTLFGARRATAPFLTMFADMRKSGINSHIYCKRHTRITHHFPFHQDTLLRAWISVEHSNNITGTGVGIKELADISKTFKQFGVTI